MNLSDYRNFLRHDLRSGNDTSRYFDLDLDHAIFATGNRMALDARCTRRATIAVDLVASTAAISLTATAGFRPEFIDSVYLNASSNFDPSCIGAGIEVVTIEELNGEAAKCGPASGVPRMVAFTDWQAAVLYPAPSEASTGGLSIIWIQPFTSWTFGVGQAAAVLSGSVVGSITVGTGGTYPTAPAVTFSGGGGTGAAATAVLSSTGASSSFPIESFTVGTAGTGYTSAPTVFLNGISAADVTFNIPDDLLVPAMTFAAIIVQLTEVEAIDKVFRSQMWKDHLDLCRGRGSLGAKVLRRDTLGYSRPKIDPSYYGIPTTP